MWLIALVWATLIVNFALDVLERKQKGEPTGWRDIRSNFFAVTAFGGIIGGGYWFLLMFPAIGKKPFPHWLGFGLTGGLLLFLWFASAFSIAHDDKRGLLSPLQVVNESVGEAQIGFLGFLAIIVVGISFVRFDFPLWVGFILVLPVWVILFYLWCFSNWILVWVLLRLRNLKR